MTSLLLVQPLLIIFSTLIVGTTFALFLVNCGGGGAKKKVISTKKPDKEKDKDGEGPQFKDVDDPNYQTLAGLDDKLTTQNNGHQTDKHPQRRQRKNEPENGVKRKSADYRNPPQQNRSHQTADSSHDDSSAFENFLHQLRTPVAKRQPAKLDMSSFVVDDDDIVAEEASSSSDSADSPSLHRRIENMSVKKESNVTQRKAKRAVAEINQKYYLTSDEDSSLVVAGSHRHLHHVSKSEEPPKISQPWLTDDEESPNENDDVNTSDNECNTGALFTEFASMNFEDNRDDPDCQKLNPDLDDDFDYGDHDPFAFGTTSTHTEYGNNRDKYLSPDPGPMTSSPYEPATAVKPRFPADIRSTRENKDEPRKLDTKPKTVITPNPTKKSSTKKTKDKPGRKPNPKITFNEDGAMCSAEIVVTPGHRNVQSVMRTTTTSTSSKPSTSSNDSDYEDVPDLNESANHGTSNAERTFLHSLNTSAHNRSHGHNNHRLKVVHRRVHPHSKLFIGTKFKRNKAQLSQKLFEVFNANVFGNKLPADTPIQWNARLRKTAGQCVYRRQIGERVVRIELSTKVCDSADRVRDTLLHELCHAACWIIDGENGGHGPLWRRWANKAQRKYPDLPMVARCHSYVINAKYIYVCENTSCGQQIKRHSKSLDIERKVCGRCRGRFILTKSTAPSQTQSKTQEPSTPGMLTPAAAKTKPPSKFALYVKDFYQYVKKQQSAKGIQLTHKEIMGILSKAYKDKQKIDAGEMQGRRAVEEPAGDHNKENDFGFRDDEIVFLD